MLLILDNEREVYLIAWAPYATFAVDVTFDALRNSLAAYIKAACRELVTAINLQIGGRCGVGCRYDKGLAVDLEVGESLLVGVCRAYHAHLVVIGLNLDAAHRMSCHNVAYRAP